MCRFLPHGFRRWSPWRLRMNVMWWLAHWCQLLRYRLILILQATQIHVWVPLQSCLHTLTHGVSRGGLGRTKVHLCETLIYCNRPSQLLVAQAMLVDIITCKVWLTWRPSHEVCPHFIVHTLREHMTSVRELLIKVWPSNHLVSTRAILRELGLLAA
jgi:hypothetical protein